MGDTLSNLHQPRLYRWVVTRHISISLILTSKGIIFSIIAPLILLFGVTAFTLLLFVFRYNALFVITPDSETDGQLHMVALQHLFVGIYVLEVYLIGLFALVRGNKDHFVCIGQLSLMVVIMMITALFQHFLYQSFWLLTQQYPLCTTKKSLSTRPSRDMREKHVRHVHDNWLDEFTDESLKGRPVVVWIPHDQFGVSTQKLYKIKAEFHNVLATDDKASIGLDAKVKIFGLPPCVVNGNPGFEDDRKIQDIQRWPFKLGFSNHVASL